MTWKNWRRPAALALVVALALLARVGLALQERVIRWDEPDMLLLGRNLLSGRGYCIVEGVPDLHYSPLFPLVAGPLYLLTGNPELAGELPYVVFGALLVLPAYLLARRLYGHRVAFICAILLAFLPSLTANVLYWGTMTEPLYVFLLLVGLYALSRCLSEESLALHALCGAAFSLAYLTRPEGIAYVALAFALLALAKTWRRTILTGKGLAGLVLYILAFLIIASPYILFLYRHTGSWMVSGKPGVTMALGKGLIERDPVAWDKLISRLDSEGREIVWFSRERFTYGMWDEFRANPRAFLGRVKRNLTRFPTVFFRRQGFPFYLLGAVFLGLFRLPWDRKRALNEAFLLLALLPLALFFLFHVDVRFFAPALPIFLMWTAKGLDELGHWLVDTVEKAGKRRLPPGLKPLLWAMPTALVVAYFLVAIPVVVKAGVAGFDFGHKEAGLWLREHSSPDAVLMARDLAVALYADRKWVPSPHEEYEVILDYARRHGASYWVIDEREVTVVRPHLSFLLDTEHPPPELKPLHIYRGTHGMTIVYRIEE